MLFGTFSAETLDQYWVPGVISLKLTAGAFNPSNKVFLVNSHKNETEFFPGLIILNYFQF